jgi:hypothetical protein
MKNLLRAINSHKVRLVMKVIGLLSFIVLCIVSVIGGPFAGNNPNTVIFVKDYGNIRRLAVMRNGQFSMKRKMQSILHTINSGFVASTATISSDACAKLNALGIGGSPDAIGLITSPIPSIGSPEASGDILENKTCLTLLGILDGTINDSDPLSDCLYGLDLSGSPVVQGGCASLGLLSVPNSDASPDDSVDINSCPDNLDSDSPVALSTCTNVTATPKKMALAGSSHMRAGEILAVQHGKKVVIGIYLGNDQVLMPGGETMRLEE